MKQYFVKLMTALLRTLANLLWIGLSIPDALAWYRATRHPAQTQRKVLTSILRRNARTRYGMDHHFDEIRTIAGFQRRVPLTSYEDYEPLIRRIGAGEAGVLTAEPVKLLEPTSGSTAAAKLIPYTDTLKRAFQRGIAPWVVHTFLRYPALLAGQAYWSVTPVTGLGAPGARRTPGGIPIGFDEESEYFGDVAGRLIDAVMAVPPEVKRIDHMASFRYVTLLFLLRSRSLALISVWNPTFLSLLLEPLEEWWLRLADDIERGTLNPPRPLDRDLHGLFLAHNKPAPQRADAIRQAITGARAETDRLPHCRADVYRRLWPNLRLISCWADANAASYAHRLARLFPHVRIQPKGLLATEAFISFPLARRTGHALSLCSHFFEFIPYENELGAKPNSGHAPLPDAPSRRDGEDTLLAHQLERDRRYSVVVTTDGGLYRYRLNDLVEVVGFRNQCPLFRFVGREGSVSDWFGEKLNEQHVATALEMTLARHELEPAFAMLACDTDLRQPAYVLYIQTAAEAGRSPASALCAARDELEEELRTNPHYDYCRRLGQLGAVRLFHIRDQGLSDYIDACIAHGQRAGDVKPVVLHRRNGWTAQFVGSFVED